MLTKAQKAELAAADAKAKAEQIAKLRTEKEQVEKEERAAADKRSEAERERRKHQKRIAEINAEIVRLS